MKQGYLTQRFHHNETRHINDLIQLVSTESGAIPEVVAGAGMLVAPRDWRKLHLKLKLLLENDKKWESYSKAGRHLAETKYSQEVVGRQIKEWYFQ